MELEDELTRVRTLSDQALLSGLNGSLGANRRSVAAVIAHLGEVEERRLHLLAGSESLFAYCLSRLRMSEDEAYRRIEVARLCRRFPPLFERLASGQISLSVAALLKSFLTPDNGEALLGDVSGKTVASAREVLARWFPRADDPSSIRKLPAPPEPIAPSIGQMELPGQASYDRSPAVPAPLTAPTAAANARTEPLGPHEPHPVKSAGASAPPNVSQPASLACPAPGALPPARPRPTPPSIQPLSPERYRVQFTASAELKHKLELARDLLRHAIPSGDLPAILERALDLLLEQTLKRRFGAKTRANAAAKPKTKPDASDSKQPPSPPAVETPLIDTATPPPPSNTRHIPSAVRRAVAARDDLRCTWQAPDGTRCSSRAWLEHDHITPRGQGGTNDPANGRILCRAHNRLAAEHVYGQHNITRIIATQRARRRGPPRQDHPASRAADTGVTSRS